MLPFRPRTTLALLVLSAGAWGVARPYREYDRAFDRRFDPTIDGRELEYERLYGAERVAAWRDAFGGTAGVERRNARVAAMVRVVDTRATRVVPNSRPTDREYLAVHVVVENTSRSDTLLQVRLMQAAHRAAQPDADGPKRALTVGRNGVRVPPGGRLVIADTAPMHADYFDRGATGDSVVRHPRMLDFRPVFARTRRGAHADTLFYLPPR